LNWIHGASNVNEPLEGGSLLIVADVVARTIVSPAELPIGVDSLCAK